LPTDPRDPRRYGVVEVRYRSGPPAIYRLTIAGQLWASVEWSLRRRRWCIEDGINRCLAHVEHIHGEDPDPQAAIRLAKKMIRDGRMPTPEEAIEALRRRQGGAPLAARTSTRHGRSVDGRGHHPEFSTLRSDSRKSAMKLHGQPLRGVRSS
jgi:hypothetical protein